MPSSSEEPRRDSDALCPVCGLGLHRHHTKIQKRTYCSMACRSEGQHPDRLCLICNKSVFWKHPRRRPRETCSRGCQGKLQRLRSEQKYNLGAFDGWSPEMAYALGLFFADGCLTHQGHSWKILMTNTELATVEWWDHFIGNPGKVVCCKRKRKKRGGLRKQCYLSTTSSDTIGGALIKHGVVPRKSTEEGPLPEVPEEMLCHFVRGFFDGDGGIWQEGFRIRASLTCNVAGFRGWLRDALFLRGVQTSKDGISLRMSGSQVEHFCEFVYGEEGPFMVRKKAVWEDWVSSRRILIKDRDWWHDLVGTNTDCAVAAEVGVSEGRVTQVRNQQGVSRFRPYKPWHALVGTMPDIEVARKVGCTSNNIGAYRRLRGIPPFRTKPWLNSSPIACHG